MSVKPCEGMTPPRPSSLSLGAMNLRPSALLKTLAVLGIFICIISLSYWGRLVSIPAILIHREPLPSQDFQFDNPTSQNWTNRIWQTSKLPLVAIGDEDREHVKTWSDLNPEYRYEMLTDEMMESYVKDHFHNSHADIERIYFEVKDYILRSDLIRYLILLADGGVYNDLDVGCEKPIKTWVPPQYKDSAGILLGVEVDNNFGPDGRTFKGGQDLFELVNWTIMSKPNQPFMWVLVKRVMENIRNLAASQNQPISRITYTIQNVVDVTGPAALTRAFFDYASGITDSNVTYLNFTKITKPRLIGEVLILPIHAFGAGHQVEWAGWKQTDGTPLVHHYFAGSWKTDHYNMASQPPPVDQEQPKKEKDAKKAEEANKKQAEEEEKYQVGTERKKQHENIVQEAADNLPEEAKEGVVGNAPDEQQQSATQVGDSSASSVAFVPPSSDSSKAKEEKPSNGQAAAKDSDEKVASDKPASVKYVEDQTPEFDSTVEASAEPESMEDMLAKAKAEKNTKAKEDAEKETNKAAQAAKEKEIEEKLAAEKAAEEKSKMEAWRKAQEDAKSDEEKEEDARKAKEQKEEEERKAKWEEVKKAAPKTAPKKTDEEKQKSSNDLTDYDYIPD